MAKKQDDIDNWMPLWIGDYLSATMELSDALHGNYLLLLFAYWKRQGPLPDDDDRLAAAARCSKDAWSIRRALLAEFFVVENGVWRHERADRELARALKHKEVAVARAKKAASARWSDASPDAPSNAPSIPSSNAPGDAPAMLEQCPPPPPITLLPSVESNEGGEGSAPPPPSGPPVPTPLPPSAPAAPTRGAVDKPVKKRPATKKAAQAKAADKPVWTGPPDWVPAEAWAMFEDMRAKAHRSIPFTDNARKLTVEELDKLRAAGHDPAEVLKQSVRNSWRGVFPVDRRTGARTGPQDRQDPPKPASHNDATAYLAEQAKHQRGAPPAELLARRRQRKEGSE